MVDAYEGSQAWIGGREGVAAQLRSQKFDVALLLQNAFDAAWMAWRANVAERIGYARDGRSFLLTKAVPLPRHGEIPAHEKFYYLELLRRAGWLDSVPEETLIALRVPEEKRRSAEEFLCNSGVRHGPLRIAIPAAAPLLRPPASPSWRCLVPPIRMEQLPSLRAGASFSKSHIAAPVFSAAARPIIGA